jgi:cob(I)alamin adenosyltransferase
MKIYTKTGDDGSTGLFGGARVPKHDARVNAYGTVDELNSVLGMVAAQEGDEAIRAMITPHQVELFNLGALMASGDMNTAKLPPLNDALIPQMEQQIDQADAELAPLRNFILPGGSKQAALLHFARTVCRRAERETSAVREHFSKLAPRLVPAIKYLNRLSDWLFTLARLANHRAGVADVPWTPNKG